MQTTRMKLLPLLSLILVACGNQPNDDRLRVFAATSLTEVSANLEPNVSWNLGGSSTLARQIEDGAGCDVYVSANRDWVDYLVDKNVADGTPIRIAGNALVLAVQQSAKTEAASLAELFGLKRIGIADPSVPAGKYAREWLGETKLNLITLGDVRSVQRAIASGEVDAGFVYATDARELKIVITSEIRVDYFALVIRDSPQAQRFIELLTEGSGRETLRQQGFTIDD